MTHLPVSISGHLSHNGFLVSTNLCCNEPAGWNSSPESNTRPDRALDKIGWKGERGGRRVRESSAAFHEFINNLSLLLCHEKEQSEKKKSENDLTAKIWSFCFSGAGSPRSIRGWRNGPWSTAWRWTGPWGSWRRSPLGSACVGCSAGRQRPTLRSTGCRPLLPAISQSAPRSHSAAHGLRAPGEEDENYLLTFFTALYSIHSALLLNVLFTCDFGEVWDVFSCVLTATANYYFHDDYSVYSVRQLSVYPS